jgi:hypothetical protein
MFDLYSNRGLQTMAATVLLLMRVVFCGPSDSETVMRYENKWIVIVGNYMTCADAETANVRENYGAEIVLSTHFDDLNPGWLMLVKGGYETKQIAQAVSDTVKQEDRIDAYVRFTGDLVDFDVRQYRVVGLEKTRKQYYDEHSYRYASFVSLDRTFTVEFQAHREDPSDFPVIKTKNHEIFFEDLYVCADEVIWSKSGMKFAFIDRDFYASSGDFGIVLIDLETEQHMYVELLELLTLNEYDDREMIVVKDVRWLSSDDGIVFSLDIDYLGYSGHPGIDMVRQEQLGENFNKEDPVKVGDFAVFLEP